MKIILGLFCFIALLASLAQGHGPEKTTGKISYKSIKNLDEALLKANKALQKVEKDSYAFVPFPASFPGDHKLYAYTEVVEETGFISISLSLNETCHGEKFCTLGSLNIKKGGSPEKQKDMSGKDITEVVKLDDNIDGYYTPGHSMGDYWPPSLQWVYKGVLYNLWWNQDGVGRKELIDMANDALIGAFLQEHS